MRLEHLLERGARATPNAIAAWETTGEAADYAALNRFSDEIAAILTASGVAAGDRVGLCAPKTIALLASVFGVLRAGAAYVPVDYSAPPARNGFIFNDCAVRAIIVETARADPLRGELSGDWTAQALSAGGRHARALTVLFRTDAADAAKAPDLAYILYTSGSTGKPKGVTHSHATAFAFIDWCSEVFRPNAGDRFSSHAPFHFDLSILDIYVPLKHGASVVLIGTDAGKQPETLARVIAERGITVWYSTPSILRMLLDYGKLDALDCSALRIVNFAGEVFPIKHLRALIERWPQAQYFNLYGPTETNVCTFYQAPVPLPDGVVAPLPIGRACSGDETRILDENDAVVPKGGEGELVVTGGSVMLGYWNLPERNAIAFLKQDGKRWYRTGDIVREDENGDLIYLGRRDRMVKRRGYRVELGEIEAALHKHPSIPEAAVVARHSEDDVSIIAYVVWTGDEPFSMVKMKQHCARTLPLYMSPDRFVALPELPKTSTDKTDYQTLQAMSG